MSGSNRCDCCETPCTCGAFCSNTPYCGGDMSWNLTTSGSSVGGGGACTCTDLDAAFAVAGPPATSDAATWNGIRPMWTGQDAKTGTNVCTWTASSGVSGSCSFGVTADLGTADVVVYQAADDKWYMASSIGYTENGGSCTLGGETVFSGGGAAMDCGSVGEGSPTFSLAVALTQYNVFGTITQCNPPTSVLIEGNPQ